MGKMKIIEVVAAVIKFKNKFFCVQRGEHKYDYLSYKFEFPGGKLENNETPKEALIREIREELDYSIKVGKQLVIVNHQYPHFQLRMSAYLCHASDTNFVLKEHVQHKWMERKQLMNLDWAAADIPIVQMLVDTDLGL